MIFNRMAQYGPRQGFGARYQQVFDREAMADMGGGMGRMHNPNGGINPGGMYTGGNLPPQVSRGFSLGGQLPPMQGQWMTGGNTPLTQSPWAGQPFGLASMFRGSAYGR